MNWLNKSLSMDVGISIAGHGFYTKFDETNPTASIYNASVVNFYNATSSLARFES
jgi:hypothetical protein